MRRRLSMPQKTAQTLNHKKRRRPKSTPLHFLPARYER
jgi:hypothetical protein